MAEIVVHTGLAAGLAAIVIIGALASSSMLAARLLGHGVFNISVGPALSTLLQTGGGRSVWGATQPSRYHG